MELAASGDPDKWSSLAHSIIVLLIGTLLTTLLVPWLTARINDRKLINDARLQTCTEILAKSSETDERLNGMNTTLEVFIKHSSSSPTSLVQQQQETRTEMEKEYREFDRQAWWWYSQLGTQAKLLRINIDNPKTLLSLIDQYQRNLIESTKKLDELWNLCLRPNFKPTDSRNSQIAALVRARLEMLRTTRASLVGQFVTLFSPLKRAWYSM